MTNMFRIRAFPALSLVCALALSACASGSDPESFGSRIATEGGEVAAIGTKWNSGEEMIAKGREMIEDGRDDVDDGERLVSKGEGKISDGRKQVTRGERMMADGARMKTEAEASYRLRQVATAPQT
jgi:hypothetical protein